MNQVQTVAPASPIPKENEVIRVLLVDDEEDAYLLISRYLSRVRGRKYKVDWARSYEAGVEALARREHHIYLIDYRLGSRTGLDLLRTAMSAGVKSPMIILTGAADPRVDMQAIKIGAADFLVKDALATDSLDRSIRYNLQHHATLLALEKSHERFRLLFDRSLDAILMSDHSGRIVEANGAACTLFGRPWDRMVLQGLETLFTAAPAIFSHGAMEEAHGELSFKRPNGDKRITEFSACAFTSDLNLVILRDVTDRRELEKEIQEISENEQRRLGQDLHDGLGQELTGIAFLAKALQQKLASQGLKESADASQLAQLISQSLSHTRNLARGLCPVMLENNDLQAALQELANHIENLFSVPCKVDCPPAFTLNDNTVEIQLYRIAQEAATNAVKHGKPKRINISLRPKAGDLTLRIVDDGIGIPLKPNSEGGMGLRIMRYRARMIGATIQIERAEGGGTAVTCRLVTSRS
jgi:PAS domain S-box-containing protein